MDVLFFGAMNLQREALLAVVNASGVAVRVLTGGTMLFGEALDAILARAKIVLNLHFYGGIMVRLRMRHHCLKIIMLEADRAQGPLQWRMLRGRLHGSALHKAAPESQSALQAMKSKRPAPWQGVWKDVLERGITGKDAGCHVRGTMPQCMLQEMSRIQHAISMRCLVVSQRSVEPELDAEWGDSIVIADDQDIPKQLRHFLEHPRSGH